MADVLYYSNVYPLLNNFLSSLIRPIYKELAWGESDGDSPGGSFTTTLLRPLILDIACNVGDKNCISVAGQKFIAWKEHNMQISPNLRSVVYSYGKRKLKYISALG